MDVNATVTTNINATSSRGQQHSEAKKADLMKHNTCFYCEIKGHQARVCRKKIADRAKHGKTADNDIPTVRSQGPIDMTPNNIASFLTENMGSLDKDTKLDIIETLMPKDFPQAQN